MTYFYIIKHANRKVTKGNPSLTKLGIRQAQLTGSYLKRIPIAAVYSSPLKRTLETAHYIAKELNLKVHIDKRLRERMNWGDNPTQSFEEFIKEWDYASNHRDFQPTVGDSSSRKAGKRLEAVIKDLAKRYRNTHVVIVTHGGIISDMLRNVFPEHELRKFKDKFPEEREKHILDCSITVIKRNRGKYYLKKFASTEHLHLS